MRYEGIELRRGESREGRRMKRGGGEKKKMTEPNRLTEQLFRHMVGHASGGTVYL